MNCSVFRCPRQPPACYNKSTLTIINGHANMASRFNLLRRGDSWRTWSTTRNSSSREEYARSVSRKIRRKLHKRSSTLSTGARIAPAELATASKKCSTLSTESLPMLSDKKSEPHTKGSLMAFAGDWKCSGVTREGRHTICPPYLISKLWINPWK